MIGVCIYIYVIIFSVWTLYYFNGYTKGKIISSKIEFTCYLNIDKKLIYLFTCDIFVNVSHRTVTAIKFIKSLYNIKLVIDLPLISLKIHSNIWKNVRNVYCLCDMMLGYIFDN